MSVRPKKTERERRKRRSSALIITLFLPKLRVRRDMKLSQTILLTTVFAIAPATGFITQKTSTFVKNQEHNIVALEAAPTMVIY